MIIIFTSISKIVGCSIAIKEIDGKDVWIWLIDVTVTLNSIFFKYFLMVDTKLPFYSVSTAVLVKLKLHIKMSFTQVLITVYYFD